MEDYRPKTIEPKWQQLWEKAGVYHSGEVPDKKRKYYALAEFPYPSGEGLHMGHAFTYTMMDVVARKKRLDGFDVLYPMGWDAFGLPAENYAIKTNTHPRLTTSRNTDRFRQQMKRLALAYDWTREVNTTEPSYYRWTQWIFLQLFKRGLAYKKKMPINWCPSCKIGLANEEVVNGKCERCGASVTKRDLDQWLLRITAYADRLDRELDLVDYPDSVKQAQRNWIGRTEGIIISYPLIGTDRQLSCYSTRPETNFGATFLVISPESPELLDIVTEECRDAVERYVSASAQKSELERTQLEKEKTGVFTGSYCLNRLNGRHLPIWVSDFVVATAGTGVVVGVPAHDQRDWEFAKRYGLEIIPVIQPKTGQWCYEELPFTDVTDATVFNSDFLDGLTVSDAYEKVINHLVGKGWGRGAVNYHLRDWVFSRQHYWGEPVPMVYCSSCAAKGLSFWDIPEGVGLGVLPPEEFRKSLVGWFPVAEAELPVKLPEIENFAPTGTGESPLAMVTDWVETTCPVCGGSARRETDTMPNWAGSSWYYLRYCDPDNESYPAAKDKLEYWLPVDTYLGGSEHTTLHLLYSRFWHKVLSDLGVVPGKEPYAKRRVHGVILGEDGNRMSKSRGNVINPEDMIREFGADSLRLYLLFMGPYDETLSWNTSGVSGCFRFLGRVWRLVGSAAKDPLGGSSPDLRRRLHRTIRKVGDDIENFKFNTALAALMSFLNSWEGSVKQGLGLEDLKSFIILLAPFAPYIAEELWDLLGGDFSVHQQQWPTFDTTLIRESSVVVAIQVNGKLRGTIPGFPGLSSEEAQRAALALPKVADALAGKNIEKTIWVQDRLLNFVTDAI